MSTADLTQYSNGHADPEEELCESSNYTCPISVLNLCCYLDNTILQDKILLFYDSVCSNYPGMQEVF